MRSPSRSDANVTLVCATPWRARCVRWRSSDTMCAYRRGFAAAPPEYSFPNTDRRLRTSYSRTSTLTPASTFCTVPTTRPSAFSSRQRSNGTSANELAFGIDAYTSRGMNANSCSKLRSSQSTWPRIFAIATVSPSGERAMKSGTARRGGLPASPTIGTPISLGC